MTRAGGAEDGPGWKAMAQGGDPRWTGTKVILWATASLLLLGWLTAWAAIAEPPWLSGAADHLGAFFTLAVVGWWLCIAGVAVSQGRWWMLVVLPCAVLPLVIVGVFLTSCARGYCI